MAKKKSAKKKKRRGDFSLTSLHRAFNTTRERLKKKGSTPARVALMQDLKNAQALVRCDQGMYRQIAVPKAKP
jgi:hypothetical protein